MRPIKAVSSANLMRGHFELCDLQSDVYNVKRNGANMVPWGAPVLEEIGARSLFVYGSRFTIVFQAARRRASASMFANAMVWQSMRRLPSG